MEDKHTTQIIRRTFWSLLPVQAMVVGIPAINGLLDTLISGNLLGQTALAAMGFTGPLNMLLVALSNVIATGSQLICGQRLGKGDREGVLKAFNTALGLCVVLGLLVEGAYCEGDLACVLGRGSHGEVLLEVLDGVIVLALEL